MTFSLLSCPPNYLWQSWLEATFPGYTAASDSGTAQSIANDPTVKSVTEKAGPALQALNEKTAPAIQAFNDTAGPAWQALNDKAGPALQSLNDTAVAATTAIQDSDVVQTVKRRATEGVETVKAKAKEFEARTGVNSTRSLGPQGGGARQTFSTPSGEAVEKKASQVEMKASSSAKKLNIKNTAIKFSLDQTLGAVFNNVLFIAGIGALRGESLIKIIANVRSVSYTSVAYMS